MNTFYQIPHEHWRPLYTINVVELLFGAARLRTGVAKRFKKVDSAPTIIWTLLQVAEKAFRRLNVPEVLPAVYASAK